MKYRQYLIIILNPKIPALFRIMPIISGNTTRRHSKAPYRFWKSKYAMSAMKTKRKIYAIKLLIARGQDKFMIDRFVPLPFVTCKTRIME